MEKKAVLTGFITKGIERVYEKYNNVSDDEVMLLDDLIAALKNINIEFEIYNSFEESLIIAKKFCKLNKDEELLGFMLLLKNILNNEEFEYADVIGLYENLSDYGYAEVNDILIYFNHQQDALREKAEELLEEQLDDINYVTDNFTIEEIAEMWIERTDKAEIIRQMLKDKTWNEILDKDIDEKGYVDYKGHEIRYCM